ncbi:hypothetical protein VNO77_03742 [Canavalia gladiata]|uniref:Uncharacterized protein n=1 Tax=Canavalia gladiata TaxID=3824 RepID=A0AAN9RCI5_CANGL
MLLAFSSSLGLDGMGTRESCAYANASRFLLKPSFGQLEWQPDLDGIASALCLLVVVRIIGIPPALLGRYDTHN